MNNGSSGSAVTTGAAVTPVSQAVCVRCGAPLAPDGRYRRATVVDPTLCLNCDRRARRSAYFRTYYESNRDRILDKNRKWARDNRERLVQLRRARQIRKTKATEEPRRCVDCGEVVIRALRCRRCYTRFRYATDPEYRVRRLATTRRWLDRRRDAGQQAADGDRSTGRLSAGPAASPAAALSA